VVLVHGVETPRNSKPLHRKRLQGAVDSTCEGRSSKSEAPGAGHADVLTRTSNAREQSHAAA
jgi:hypothetical protein